MSPIKNVVIAGATGNLGPAILSALKASPSKFKISILTRDASKANLDPEIKTTETDYTFSSLTTALAGADAVVSTLGAIGTMSQLPLIDAAIAAGVKIFIPSDFAPYSPDLSEIESVVPELYIRLKPKAMVIEYLVKKAEENPGFSWTAVGSGPLFDWTLKTGFLGTSLPLRTATIIDFGSTKYLTTTSSQISRAVASILSLSPNPSIRNKYLTISSFLTTQKEVVASCEKVTGSEFRVEHVTSVERGKEGKEMLAKGNFMGIGRLWNVWGHADGTERAFLRRELANDLLGLPQEDMEVVIRALLNAGAK